MYYTVHLYLKFPSNKQKGTKAPQAAGKIHTDFERGFVMAEVMKFDDFKEEGSEAGAKVQQSWIFIVENYGNRILRCPYQAKHLWRIKCKGYFLELHVRKRMCIRHREWERESFWVIHSLTCKSLLHILNSHQS